MIWVVLGVACVVVAVILYRLIGWGVRAWAAPRLWRDGYPSRRHVRSCLERPWPVLVVSEIRKGARHRHDRALEQLITRTDPARVKQERKAREERIRLEREPGIGGNA